MRSRTRKMVPRYRQDPQLHSAINNLLHRERPRHARVHACDKPTAVLLQLIAQHIVQLRKLHIIPVGKCRFSIAILASVIRWCHLASAFTAIRTRNAAAYTQSTSRRSRRRFQGKFPLPAAFLRRPSTHPQSSPLSAKLSGSNDEDGSRSRSPSFTLMRLRLLGAGA